jgi:hypothetical protein
MDIIRPRLTDYHGIHKNQADLDFAIQFFDEDIPLCVSNVQNEPINCPQGNLLAPLIC